MEIEKEKIEAIVDIALRYHFALEEITGDRFRDLFDAQSYAGTILTDFGNGNALQIAAASAGVDVEWATSGMLKMVK